MVSVSIMTSKISFIYKLRTTLIIVDMEQSYFRI
jgi:hypothetical protein